MAHGVAATAATAAMAVAVTTGCLGSSAQATARLDRGLWVWQDVKPAPVLTFAGEHRVTRLWLATPAEPTRADSARLTRTIRMGARQHVRISALGGSPRWATHPRWAVEWAKRSLAAAPFDGLHVDVEPYSLGRWDTDRRRVVTGYLRMLDLLDGLPGRLEVDVPFWYGTVRARGHTLADEVLTRVDAITVMSYRDEAMGTNGILAVSRDWLARGARADIPIRLGAETNELTDCTYCTFYEEGATALDREQRQVTRRLADRSAFAGVAVHDLMGWRALLTA
jgi:hypothetical protein